MQGNLRGLISCAKIGVRIQCFEAVSAVLSWLSGAGVITQTSDCREREVVKCCIPLQFLLGQSVINNIVNVTDTSIIKGSAGGGECQQNLFDGPSRQV
jgi:hypothetical protein